MNCGKASMKGRFSGRGKRKRSQTTGVKEIQTHWGAPRENKKASKVKGWGKEPQKGRMEGGKF